MAANNNAGMANNNNPPIVIPPDFDTYYHRGFKALLQIDDPTWVAHPINVMLIAVGITSTTTFLQWTATDFDSIPAQQRVNVSPTDMIMIKRLRRWGQLQLVGNDWMQLNRHVLTTVTDNMEAYERMQIIALQQQIQAANNVPPAPTVTSAADSYMKRIRIDPSVFPVIKEEVKYRSWRRETQTIAKNQGIDRVFNEAFDPATIPAGDEKAEWDRQQNTGMTILLRTVQWYAGRVIVRRHLDTSDAHAAFKEMYESQMEGNYAERAATLAENKLKDMALSNTPDRPLVSWLTTWVTGLLDLEEITGKSVSDEDKKKWLTTSLQENELMRQEISSANRHAQTAQLAANVGGVPAPFNFKAWYAQLHEFASETDAVNLRRKEKLRKIKANTTDASPSGGSVNGRGSGGGGRGFGRGGGGRHHQGGRGGGGRGFGRGDQGRGQGRGRSNGQSSPSESRQIPYDIWRTWTPERQAAHRAETARLQELRRANRQTTANQAQQAPVPEMIQLTPVQSTGMTVNSSVTAPTMAPSAARGHMTRAFQSQRQGQISQASQAPSQGTQANTQTFVANVNGTPYQFRAATSNVKYRVTQAANEQTQLSLIDRGANGSIAGRDMMCISLSTTQFADVTGIDDHVMQNLPLGQFAAKIWTYEGPAIAICNQYAYGDMPTTIHSAVQLEHFSNDVSDKAEQLGGQQRLLTPNNEFVPFTMLNGLIHLQMSHFTDDEWDTLPHIVFTSDSPWDPTQYDGELSMEALVDANEALALEANTIDLTVMAAHVAHVAPTLRIHNLSFEAANRDFQDQYPMEDEPSTHENEGDWEAFGDDSDSFVEPSVAYRFELDDLPSLEGDDTEDDLRFMAQYLPPRQDGLSVADTMSSTHSSMPSLEPNIRRQRDDSTMGSSTTEGVPLQWNQDDQSLPSTHTNPNDANAYFNVTFDYNGTPADLDEFTALRGEVARARIRAQMETHTPTGRGNRRYLTRAESRAEQEAAFHNARRADIGNRLRNNWNYRPMGLNQSARQFLADQDGSVSSNVSFTWGAEGSDDDTIHTDQASIGTNESSVRSSVGTVNGSVRTGSGSRSSQSTAPSSGSTIHNDSDTVVEYPDDTGVYTPHELVVWAATTAVGNPAYSHLGSRPARTILASNQDPEKLRPYFLYLPTERIMETLRNTTQLVRAEKRHPPRNHILPRFPAMNVRRLHGDTATDAMISETGALADGIPGHANCQYLQVFVHLPTRHVRGYPMDNKSQFPSTLLAYAKDVGAPVGLFSDCAAEETSKEVIDITRHLMIRYHKKSEPENQQQNPAERVIGDIERTVNVNMDRAGSPAPCWLLCALYAIFVFCNMSQPRLNGMTPHQAVYGDVPDISAILQFHWFEKVRYSSNSTSLDRTNARPGYFVGVAENIGDHLTYLILDAETLRVVPRSVVEARHDDLNPNLRLGQPHVSSREGGGMFVHTEDGEEEVFSLLDKFDPSSKETGEMVDPDFLFDPTAEEQSVYEAPPSARPQAHSNGTRSTLPAFAPDELVGKVFMYTLSDGEPIKAEVVRKLQTMDAANHQNIKMLLKLGDGEVEDVVEYVTLCDLIEAHNETAKDPNAIQAFKKIIGHQGPLSSRSPQWKQSKYNVKLLWEDDTESWEPLNVVATTDPVTCAAYGRENGLIDKPGWQFIKKIARRQKLVVNKAKAIKSKAQQGPRFKFGVQVPRNAREARRLDAEGGHTKWANAEKEELDNLFAYDTFIDLGLGASPPEGYQRINTIWVYDCKHDFRHKARMVAGGHTTAPVDDAYSSVISLEIMRLAIAVGEINGLTPMVGDIGNAYLEAKTKEKIYFIAGPEFGDLQGHTLVIYKALYGLRTSGARFHERLADALRAEGFVPSLADPDLWLREADTCYEYICVWVDDLMAIMSHPDAFFDTLRNKYKFKLKGVGQPEYHLGGNFGRDPDGTLYWGSKTYIEKLLKSYERHFNGPPAKYGCPLDPNAHPELDQSPFLNERDTGIYMSLVGACQWAITLGRFDIGCAIACLGRFRAQPREGHLECLKRVCGYLRKYPDSAIRFRTQWPMNEIIFGDSPTYDWQHTVYGGAKEETLSLWPQPKGQMVRLTTAKDASLMHCKVSGKSQIGIVHFINQVPFKWWSKLQDTVENATFGSEFGSARVATDQIMGTRYSLRAMGVPIEETSWMLGDNQSVITQSTIPSSVMSKRHNALAYHRVRWAVAAGIIKFVKIPGKENISDCLTKFLPYIDAWPLLKPVLFWHGETMEAGDEPIYLLCNADESVPFEWFVDTLDPGEAYVQDAGAFDESVVFEWFEDTLDPGETRIDNDAGVTVPTYGGCQNNLGNIPHYE